MAMFPRSGPIVERDDSARLARGSSTRSLIESRFMSATYGWMFVGLLVTAGVSLAMASSESAMQILVENRGIFYGALIAEFVLVMGLSAAMARLSAMAATLGFLAYSALNGVTFSMLFMAYTAASISQVFLITAGMFGGLALFGTVTKRNLSAMGTFMAMGLWGLILMSVVNMFMHSDALSFGTSVVGVIIFSGLAAYDAQKIRAMAMQFSGGPAGYAGSSEMERKGAVFGALTLYLDFINLFLSLLRLFGNRRD